MAGKGVHFAVSSEEEARLLNAADDDARRAVVREIKERGDEARRAFSDQAWDAMHRCLSNGTLFYDEGEYPLNHAVLGGGHLYGGDDSVIAHVSPSQVKEVAAALGPLTADWLRKRYFELDPDEYDGPHGEEDFGHLWERFQGVRDFFARAATEGWAVIFTVDP